MGWVVSRQLRRPWCHRRRSVDRWCRRVRPAASPVPRHFPARSSMSAPTAFSGSPPCISSYRWRSPLPPLPVAAPSTAPDPYRRCFPSTITRSPAPPLRRPRPYTRPVFSVPDRSRCSGLRWTRSSCSSCTPPPSPSLPASTPTTPRDWRRPRRRPPVKIRSVFGVRSARPAVVPLRPCRRRAPTSTLAAAGRLCCRPLVRRGRRCSVRRCRSFQSRRRFTRCCCSRCRPPPPLQPRPAEAARPAIHCRARRLRAAPAAAATRAAGSTAPPISAECVSTRPTNCCSTCASTRRPPIHPVPRCRLIRPRSPRSPPPSRSASARLCRGSVRRRSVTLRHRRAPARSVPCRTASVRHRRAITRTSRRRPPPRRSRRPAACLRSRPVCRVRLPGLRRCCRRHWPPSTRRTPLCTATDWVLPLSDRELRCRTTWLTFGALTLSSEWHERVIWSLKWCAAYHQAVHLTEQAEEELRGNRLI